MKSQQQWEKVRLGDIIAVKHGWPFKSEYIAEELTGRSIVVNIGNFSYTGGFRFETTRTREYRGNYPEEYELRPGDILLVMTCQTSEGEILGVPARVPDDGRIYLHNQRLGKVVVVRPDKVELDYLYWLFLWREFNHELYVTASGTKILHTAPKRIEDFEFDLPPLNEQRKITGLLCALENKIRLNASINTTLDKIAERLFEQWFVDFEFPNEEGKPYKSSGGEFVHDERLGKRIPKKWKVKTLDEISLNFDSKRIPLSSREREKRKGNYPYYGAAGVLDCVNDYIFDGTYVLMGEDGTVVDDRGHPSLQFVKGRFWVNNHAHVLQGDGISSELLYLFLKNTNVQRIVTGAVQPKINQANMSALAFAIPDDASIGRLQGIIIELRDAVFANLNQSATLVQIRDLLLPKLMSGKIRVPVPE